MSQFWYLFGSIFCNVCVPKSMVKKRGKKQTVQKTRIVNWPVVPLKGPKDPRMGSRNKALAITSLVPQGHGGGLGQQSPA